MWEEGLVGQLLPEPLLVRPWTVLQPFLILLKPSHLDIVYGHQSGVFSVIVSLHSIDIRHQLL